MMKPKAEEAEWSIKASSVDPRPTLGGASV
jgi:hypothetical protein